MFKKCYVSPVYYKEHFYPTSQICSVSHADRLMYLNVPKSGSSTSRTVFAAGFGAVDNQMCGPGKPSWSTHKKARASPHGEAGWGGMDNRVDRNGCLWEARRTL